MWHKLELARLKLARDSLATASEVYGDNLGRLHEIFMLKLAQPIRTLTG
jgi:hypothetical protein